MTLHLDGRGLTIAALAGAAEGAGAVTLDPQGLARMEASHAMLLRAVAEDRPIYGVTTGLGARAGDRLGADALAAVSVETIRARAHAVGPPEPREIVRAAMIVRLNTLLSGHAAASPGLARHLAACLGAGLTPVVPAIGSVGVADLTWNATLALGLIGEAPLVGPSGVAGPGAAMLAAHGIAPWGPGPRDGLALVGHACGVIACAALALRDTGRAFEAAQTAAALTMLAMRANPTPFRADVLACGPHPGHAAAAEGIGRRLAGSVFGDAPRLQDPLSIRNIPQIHGTVVAALAFAEAAVRIDLNGSSDNPVALVERGEILSCGAYFTAHLTNAAETVARAVVHLATAQVARLAKLCDPAFSGLPLFLAAPGGAGNGFAPVLKTAEALLGEVMHDAQPAAIWPSIGANGTEDVLAQSPVAARALGRIARHAMRLSAIELILAAQAVDLRGEAARPGACLARTLAAVRAASAPLGAARPLGAEIERLATQIATGAPEWAPPA